MSQERLLIFLESVLGKSKSTSKSNHAFNCPFCNHSKKKFEIDIETQHQHCWSCNASGKKLTTLFKKLNVSQEKVHELHTLLNIKVIPRNINDIFSVHNEINNESVELPKEYKPLWTYSDSIEYKNAYHYITKKRNLSQIEIIKYQIGYCESGEYDKRIIIPSFDKNGKLNYFVSRKYYDSDTMKYKNPRINKNIIGFELFVNFDKPVILVEGVFDAFAIKRNVIPLFGKTISEELMKKLVVNSVKDVYICLDKDAQKEAVKHAETLMNYGKNVYFIELGKKDPSEIGFLAMTQIIKNTNPMDLSKLVEYKLNFR